LPVVDREGRPVGLLDIVDMVGMVPATMLEIPLELPGAAAA